MSSVKTYYTVYSCSIFVHSLTNYFRVNSDPYETYFLILIIHVYMYDKLYAYIMVRNSCKMKR